MDQNNSPLQDRSDRSDIKSLNRWLIGLAVVIIIWAAGIIMYVDKKTSPSNYPLPVIMVDSITGKVIDPAYTNLFHNSIFGEISNDVNISDIKTSKNAVKPLFEEKDSYNIKDFVIVNYFYVEGIVVNKSGNIYTIMYKDHNHVLQKVTLSKEFLLSPTSHNSVSPLSLLID
jgi:hypothetical protein